jgi:TetR/AcrR family transcriptional repressor of mexJK operon
MPLPAETEFRSELKHRAILEAATALFLEKGYDGTSMDDVAARSAVSKPTVYRHFADKERLFAEIVQATTNQVDAFVRMISETLNNAASPEAELVELGRKLVDILMQPQMLRLRRLVIANAERFPDVARTWYDQGFGRVLTTLAKSFDGMADRGLLRLEDPLRAANHFVSLLLWIPINEAMFTGVSESKAQAERVLAARSAIQTFLRGYGPRGSGAAQ